MRWFLVVIFQVVIQARVQALLFTAEAERVFYTAQLGDDILMGCHFFPLPADPRQDVMVSWYRMAGASVQEVYRIDNGVEQVETQHPDFRGRARLLTEDINDGWARLQVSRLRINDSGTYQCVVRTSEGADYKDMKLSVTAPYKTVTKSILKAAEGEELLLTCQSEGYPETAVGWEDARRQNLTASTSVQPSADHLFRITSQIRVGSLEENNYTCSFRDGGHSATFVLPDDVALHTSKHVVLVRALLGTCIAIAAICLIAVLLLAYPHKACLCGKEKKQMEEEEEEEEEERRSNRGYMDVFRKRCLALTSRTRRHSGAAKCADLSSQTTRQLLLFP
ncbi:programmed cell death 1 ligand 1-like isoform X2 [Dunckerocampus dactyliophorus]|uniref:programmed cell death 1 ligand 1-like isoform X2 n=1 Tax=Dunckerocampus dactyliophorus TaxID=161453 RepID=UPI0024066EEB|nr:programmed cell death 1 ligand 1-like isoform X2 [Dunckerocampus dactyliophorus]